MEPQGSFSSAMHELIEYPTPDHVHKILWQTLVEREPSLNEHITNVEVQKMVVGSLHSLVGAMQAEGVPQNDQMRFFAITANIASMVTAAICTKYDLVNKASLKLE